jgi:hypothetical protein
MAGCAPSRASHERSEACRHLFGQDANHEIEDRHHRCRLCVDEAGQGPPRTLGVPVIRESDFAP